MTMKYNLSDQKIRKIDFNQFLNDQPTSSPPHIQNQFTTRLKTSLRLRRESTPHPTVRNPIKFESLPLAEFLKVAIVGEHKFDDTHSKEILRSLNGTWFKEIRGSHATTNLPHSLGIRRGSSLKTYRNQGHNPEEQFKESFREPAHNTSFPLRRTLKTADKQRTLSHTKPVHCSQQKEVIGRILFKYQGRSVQKKLSRNCKNQGQEGGIKGVKMVLHS